MRRGEDPRATGGASTIAVGQGEEGSGETGRVSPLPSRLLLVAPSALCAPFRAILFFARGREERRGWWRKKTKGNKRRNEGKKKHEKDLDGGNDSFLWIEQVSAGFFSEEILKSRRVIGQRGFDASSFPNVCLYTSTP